MIFAEPGGLLFAAIFAVSMLGAYALYRMFGEGIDGLRRMMRYLRGDRRGERHG